MTRVFIIPFHVSPLEGSIMPSALSGAYVNCYSQGDTYVDATERALEKLALDGLYPEEILKPIYEMESTSWAEHVSESWPDYVDQLPSQAEFSEAIESNSVVYGPFGSYDTQ